MAPRTTQTQEVDILSVKKNPVKDFLKNFWIILVAFGLSIAVILFIFFAYKPAGNKETALPETSLLTPSADMPYLGKAEAPVNVIVLTDLQNEDSYYFFMNVEPSLQKNYIVNGKVKLYLWPSLSSDDGVKAFESLYCAKEQNKYWEYRTVLMNDAGFFQGTIMDRTEIYYRTTGIKSQLDTELFFSCLSDGRYKELILTLDRQRRDMNLTTVSTALVNGRPLVAVTFQELKVAIERAGL